VAAAQRAVAVAETLTKERELPERAEAREHVEQFHSTASLARELMSPAEASRFDREIESVVRRWPSPNPAHMSPPAPKHRSTI
jgi:hypothetical protein